MQIHALVVSFMNYIKVEKGLATNSLTAYDRVLRKFEAFAEKRSLSLEAVSGEHIVEFPGELYRKGRDRHCEARHKASLRNFFRFGLAEGAITLDPMLNLESPKT